MGRNFVCPPWAPELASCQEKGQKWLTQKLTRFDVWSRIVEIQHNWREITCVTWHRDSGQAINTRNWTFSSCHLWVDRRLRFEKKLRLRWVADRESFTKTKEPLQGRHQGLSENSWKIPKSSWYHQHISLQGRGGEVCRRWPRPLACRWQPQQKQSMWYMNIIEYTWCIQAPLLRIGTKQCLSKFPEDPAKATAGKVRHAKTVRKACKPQIWRVQRCATFWCKCG